jgi:hypothetical protein
VPDRGVVEIPAYVAKDVGGNEDVERGEPRTGCLEEADDCRGVVRARVRPRKA